MLVSKRGFAINLLFTLALISFGIQAYLLAENVYWYQIFPEIGELFLPAIFNGILLLLLPVEILLVGMILVSLHFSKLDSEGKEEA